MPFDYEVFISYSHLDNKPLLEGRKGWITQFDELLDNLLSEFLGSEAKIWRDNMIRGDDLIEETLKIQLPRVAIMVSVLSPRYIQAPWCLWEVKEFCRVAKQTGGYTIGNKSRIYKVIKTPFKPEGIPEIFKELNVNGYKFFREVKNGAPRTFTVGYADEAEKDFLDKVGDLAYDIANLLEMIRDQSDGPQIGGASNGQGKPPMRGGSGNLPTADLPGKRAIYLAQPTPDLTRECENIRRDLLERKIEVLPDHPLPQNLDEMQAVVHEALSRCRLSIHLVGQEYGECPAGDNHSYAYWQYQLADEHLSSPEFSRLIWMPKGIEKPRDVRQWSFVKDLVNASSPESTDLLATSLEDFKTAIQDKLRSDSEPPPASITTPDSRSIYIIAEAKDGEVAELVKRYLIALGHKPVLLATSGDEAQLRKDHEINLLKCDGALIVWNTAPLLWLLMKLDDLQKIRGHNPMKDRMPKAVFICGEETPEKRRLQASDSETFVVKDFREVTLQMLEMALRPFLNRLESDEEAQAI